MQTRRGPVYTSFALAAIAAISLVGCGDDSTGSERPAVTTTVVTTTTVDPGAGGADPGSVGSGGAPGNGGAGGKSPSGGGSNSGDGTQNGPGEGNAVGK